MIFTLTKRHHSVYEQRAMSTRLSSCFVVLTVATCVSVAYRIPRRASYGDRCLRSKWPKYCKNHVKAHCHSRCYADTQTQTLSSMCAEPSARSHTPQHNAQGTAHIRVHMRTLNHGDSQTPFKCHFRCWHFVSAPACSSSGAANARNKTHPVAERRNRAVSGAHSQQVCEFERQR